MDRAKLPIVNLHPCIQGEGQSTGIPMILIRMTKCNLNCMFRGSICDANETSWNHDPRDGEYSLQDISDMLDKHPHIHRVMITGGQPTYQPEIFKEIVRLCKAKKKKVEIEDNGTTYIPMAKDEIDLITISPKLRNSIPVIGVFVPEIDRKVTVADFEKHERSRKKYSSMRRWIKTTNYQLKFVISSEEEIEEALFVATEIGADRSKIYFMPEGATRDQLNSRRKWLYERCIELGINYTDRLHIVVYDDLKGV